MKILEDFDAFILAIGAEQPRELPVKGRDLKEFTLRWSTLFARIAKLPAMK